MPERPATLSLLIALALSLPLPAFAQNNQPLTAVERAQREADRVFDVIRFHTIRSKPATEAVGKPQRPASPPAQRVERPARAAPAAALHAEPAESNSAAAVIPETAPPSALAMPTAVPTPPAAEPVSTAPVAEAEAEVESEADEADEMPLRLQNFVAPVLTPALQATLGAGSRQVRVRLTVEADGKVSRAEAAANVPRRLAKPATDAILQWQFAPLPQARTADVDISFRRD